MKFLILAPFLLAPALSQFGFIGDVANTIAHTAQEGVKTVERVAVNEANQVVNTGKQFVGTVESVAGKIGQLGNDIGHGVASTFNPPQPVPEPAPEIVSQPVPEPVIPSQQPKAPSVEPVPQQVNSAQNLKKQQATEQNSDSESSISSADQQKQHKPHHKYQGSKGSDRRRNRDRFNSAIMQDMKIYRDDMQKLIKEFTQLRDQYEREGKQITDEIIKQHKKEMKRLRKQMKKLRSNHHKPKGPRGSRKAQNEEIVFDIDQERLVMKQKIRQSKDLPQNERQMAHEQMKKQFQLLKQAKKRFGGHKKSFVPEEYQSKPENIQQEEIFSQEDLIEELSENFEANQPQQVKPEQPNKEIIDVEENQEKLTIYH